MNTPDPREIRMIPLDKITVVNPRVRGQKKFRQIANNIANIGLKKPITVTPKPGTDDEYLLICGQGRYEAYETLGQKEIPAIVIDVSEDKLLLMSLVENLARMEREMDSLAMDFKQIDEVHGKNVLNLVISVGYLRALLDNARVVRYLAGNYPEILTELQKVADSRMLEGESKQNSPESDTPPADDAESS